MHVGILCLTPSVMCGRRQDYITAAPWLLQVINSRAKLLSTNIFGLCIACEQYYDGALLSRILGVWFDLQSCAQETTLPSAEEPGGGFPCCRM